MLSPAASRATCEAYLQLAYRVISRSTTEGSRQRTQRAQTDTLPGLKPHGFSVHPRRHFRESPKALPAPLDVSGRVLIPVQARAAVRARVPAHGKALVDDHAAPSAPLARQRWACRDPFPT